jgi:hypothetical protein
MEAIETINTETAMRGMAVTFATREEAEAVQGIWTVDEHEGRFYVRLGSDGGFNTPLDGYVGKRMIRTLLEDARGENFISPERQRRARQILNARG